MDSEGFEYDGYQQGRKKYGGLQGAKRKQYWKDNINKRTIRNHNNKTEDNKATGNAIQTASTTITTIKKKKNWFENSTKATNILENTIAFYKTTKQKKHIR